MVFSFDILFYFILPFSEVQVVKLELSNCFPVRDLVVLVAVVGVMKLEEFLPGPRLFCLFAPSGSSINLKLSLSMSCPTPIELKATG